MEGVGARLGRSSSRYGTTTVFNGPVRKWTKKWVTVPPSSGHRAAAHSHRKPPPDSTGAADATAHLLLYKWTPMSHGNKENNDSNNGGIESSFKEEDTDFGADAGSDLPQKRKFRYVPVAALEPKKDAEEITDDEAVSVDTDLNASEPTLKSDGHNEKPDINDVPMEEDQVPEKDEMATERQDLNESTLNLNFGFTEQDSDPRTELVKDAQ